MRLTQIDLNLLVAFDVIYAERNLTRAAEKLHLTQPTVSHTLARLRDLFGDALFTRGKSAMVPTPFAQRIAGPIRKALEGLERELVPSGPFDPSRLERRFAVGLRDVLESAWLPALAARLERLAPLVNLVIARIRPRRIEEELAAGAADLVADIPIPTSKGTCHEPLIEDRLMMAVRKGHPRVKGKTIDLETYLALRHIRVSSSARSAGLEDMALDALNRQRRVAVRCHSYAAAARVIAETDLALTLPAIVVPHIAGSAVRVTPLPFAMTPVAIHLYWHVSSDTDVASRWLRDQVIAVARAT